MWTFAKYVQILFESISFNPFASWHNRNHHHHDHCDHCLAKCVHVIKTGCRPLSLSLCVLAHLYSLISSQVAIKSCTAAKTAQIPASKPGPWLAGSEQALALTGPTLSCDRGPIGLFAQFFCKLFIQRGADRCLCTAEAIGRVTRTECVRKKSKWPQFPGKSLLNNG